MPIHFDIKKDLRYQQGFADGLVIGEEKARQKRKEQGRLEGERIAISRIAKSLLSNGRDIVEISKVIGIDVSKLRKLIKTG
ncbi:MAG: hypothetical protein DI535_07775 [Citrobacter freundii]|nr:MAG: hypothetical protein DI535_07775 [Citrobacter freundii]